jgi:hypothetical protein
MNRVEGPRIDTPTEQKPKARGGGGGVNPMPVANGGVMDGGRSHRRLKPPQRAVESAVLASVIERDPDSLPHAELLAEMTAVARNPERTAEVEAAVEGLVEVGLLVRTDGLLRATPASLRAGELELGL